MSTSLPGLAAGLLGLALAAAPAPAQFDAQVSKITVNQGMQTGTTPLVGGRSAYVRAQIRLINPPTLPLPLDGVMRVFVDGVEAPDSPVFSINGPFPAPASPDLSIEDGTLNFFYLPPVSNDVEIIVEVNPPGPNFVPEADVGNNSLSTGSLVFNQKFMPEMAYAPIDYRPGGGSVPNVPDPLLIEPGAGDNFIQGIYPVPDWDYHRIDAPSKLWTSSLNSSGTGLLNSLNVDILLMNPVPDFLYGWVPGGLPYNGVSFLNGVVAIGNTQTFKYQRTFAHELGHNFGLSHVNWLIGLYGIDVEDHLAITEGLPTIKAPNLNDIMVPGLNTNQAWVTVTNYLWFFGHPVLNQPPPAPQAALPPALVVNGIWHTDSGRIELSNVLEVPAAAPSAPSSQPELLVRTYSGGALAGELPVAGATGTDSCAEHHEGDSGAPVTQVGFQAVLPVGAAPIERLEIVPAPGVEATRVELTRSASPPVVHFTSPADGDVSAGRLQVSWTGSDADGDALTYYLRYSNDGTRFVPLATGITETAVDVDLTGLPALVDGRGFFELRASDGLNTAVATSPFLFGSGSFFGPGGNPPWTEIVTPDDGTTYNKGTTVILRCSGWDLEDRSLTGSSLQWTSDLDGPIGTGRVTSTANLSVGTHVITATATDSGGLTAFDSHTITIVDRGLPMVDFGTTYCTAKTASAGCLGQIAASGKPSLTDPSPYDVGATSVLNNKNGLLFYGYAIASLPFQGGTLCVQPPLRRTPIQSSAGNPPPDDCSGTLSFDFNAQIQSGTDPMLALGVEVFAQFWYRDPADPTGFGIGLTDALRFTIQP